jgi:hypothetical protein
MSAFYVSIWDMSVEECQDKTRLWTAGDVLLPKLFWAVFIAESSVLWFRPEPIARSASSLDQKREAQIKPREGNGGRVTRHPSLVTRRTCSAQFPIQCLENAREADEREVASAE